MTGYLLHIYRPEIDGPRPTWDQDSKSWSGLHPRGESWEVRAYEKLKNARKAWRYETAYSQAVTFSLYKVTHFGHQSPLVELIEQVTV